MSGAAKLTINTCRIQRSRVGMDVKEELYKSMLAEIWVQERFYPLSHKLTYIKEESKEDMEYKQYISDLRQKIITLNDRIKKNAMNKDLIEHICLPSSNSKIKITWEILNLIKHHNNLISQFQKWENL